VPSCPKSAVVLPQLLSYAGLPFSKDLVDSKPALRGSNIPAIQLWQKPCWANLFDGQVAAGPIPVLLSQFAEDPDLIQVTIVPALFSLSLFLSHSWSQDSNIHLLLYTRNLCFATG
jgi:hypothetical protein